MRTFGKWLGRAVLLIVFAVALLWVFGPREPVEIDTSFDATALGDDPAAYLATQEVRFDDITPGAEKRIIWAGEAGEKTPLSIVYVHGFSATSEEIRPVPDMLAQSLGANLHYTRLAGHGRGGVPLSEATVGDWFSDLGEALAIGRAIGDNVLIMSTSTGGSVVALAARDEEAMENVAGLVFVSPNFGIANPIARILTWPAARYWVPVVAGGERCFEARNELHATFWTSCYPTTAVMPMAALAETAAGADYSTADLPALWVFSDADSVVKPAVTRDVAARWGGPSELAVQEVAPGNDPYNHVIAGAALSPDMTAPVAQAILDWIDRNGLSAP